MTTENLKSMLHDFINGDTDGATSNFHTYLAAKLKDVSGISNPQEPIQYQQNNFSSDFDHLGDIG